MKLDHTQIVCRWCRVQLFEAIDASERPAFLVDVDKIIVKRMEADVVGLYVEIGQKITFFDIIEMSFKLSRIRCPDEHLIL